MGDVVNKDDEVGGLDFVSRELVKIDPRYVGMLKKATELSEGAPFENVQGVGVETHLVSVKGGDAFSVKLYRDLRLATSESVLQVERIVDPKDRSSWPEQRRYVEIRFRKDRSPVVARAMQSNGPIDRHFPMPSDEFAKLYESFMASEVYNPDSQAVLSSSALSSPKVKSSGDTGHR